ncbi:hypothetical protein AGMMS49992_26940 [Clostridia bacterium]|nr:hypothetical protein AGMMS49992_26940 [Clostridia bacterium]
MNLQEIARTLGVFKLGGLVELRAVGNMPISGYFHDFSRLFDEIRRYPNETFYFVLNAIRDDCYSREQCEKLVIKPKTTTSDSDIRRREWVLIDADPVRVTGVGATDAEKESALHMARRVYSYLRNLGFSEPVIADSGNGYHLLYRVNLRNSDENRDIVKAFLQALDMLFSDELAAIDTAVFNASRITKLYGVIARKGADTPERPHRQSKLLHVPDEITPNSIELFKKIAALFPAKPDKKSSQNASGFGAKGASNFDVDEFISRHGISVSKTASCSMGTKYVLDECVFDSNHKTPDAAIIVMDSGAIAYHCFHNSCQRYRWQDVRLKFEPDAYDPKDQPLRITTPEPTITSAPLLPPGPNDTPDLFGTPEPPPPKYLRLPDITRQDRSQIVSIPSGINLLDRKLIGFNKGELSIWSGGNGSGKSTMLAQLALESINRGFCVAMFSGELTDKRMKNWLHLQAAGKQFTEPTQYDGVYFTPPEIGVRIDQWAGDKLWLYNNDYGTNARAVITDTLAHMREHATDVVIIDNLMSLDLSTMPGDKLEKQSAIVLMVSEIAKRYNVHIHFVCHPRKPTGFLRKTDISGTADLTNAADNVFMLHRVNDDFRKLAVDFFEKGKAERYFEYSNVLEVMKNRDLGIEGEMIGMYFEKESKRLLNTPDEQKTYNWLDVEMSTFDKTVQDPFIQDIQDGGIPWEIASA